MPEIASLDTELALLEEAFAVRLERMPAALAAAARTLPDRLSIRPGRPPLWTARLSPLVVLYPLLRTEGLAEVTLESSRRATLAHLFLLVHAFADDHLLDGQTGMTREEIVFAKEALLEAAEILASVAGDDRLVDEEMTSGLRRYHRAQISCLAATPAERRRDLVVDRAALGGVATRVVVRAAGCSGELLAEIDTSFGALVVALQWEDDIHDWPSDLATGQDNLLLATLGEAELSRLSGPEAVEEELIRRGSYDAAFRQFAAEMDLARRPRGSHADRQLAICLDARRLEVEALAGELRRAILAQPLEGAPSSDPSR